MITPIRIGPSVGPRIVKLAAGKALLRKSVFHISRSVDARFRAALPPPAFREVLADAPAPSAQ
jgi:hypothetical protein